MSSKPHSIYFFIKMTLKALKTIDEIQLLFFSNGLMTINMIFSSSACRIKKLNRPHVPPTPRAVVCPRLL